MGNDQSRGSSSQAQVAEKTLNYYELLQIDEDAEFDEIKVSVTDPCQGFSLTVPSGLTVNLPWVLEEIEKITIDVSY
jgi:hypothetical protein